MLIQLNRPSTCANVIQNWIVVGGVQHCTHRKTMAKHMTGWWLTYPSDKYEFVNDYSQLNGKIKNVPNHLPDEYCGTTKKKLTVWWWCLESIHGHVGDDIGLGFSRSQLLRKTYWTWIWDSQIWIYPLAMVINFNVGDGLKNIKGIHRFPKFEKLRLSHYV